MEERTLTVSLDTAKEWYNKGRELKKLALQVYTEDEITGLPSTWEGCVTMLEKSEYVSTQSSVLQRDMIDVVRNLQKPENHNLDPNIDKNIVPEGLGKPILALCQLLVCREIYRQGWKPDWMDENEKYIISCFDNYVSDEHYCVHESRILSFQSEEIRNKFLNNFKNLIEEAKELL